MDDLIRRAQDGEGDAFIALFEREKQSMWRAALAVLGNTEDASDALQETATKAWKALPRFENRSSIGTWLMRILLRTCYDVRRSRGREMPFAPDCLNTYFHSDTLMREPVAAKLLLATMERSGPDSDKVLDVRTAIRRLSSEDRLILVMFYVNDFSVRHISTILKVTEGAVRTRLSRARDRFKVAYEGKVKVKAEVAR